MNARLENTPPVHSFIRSFNHSYIRKFVRLLVRSVVRSLVHSFVRSFVNSFLRSVIRSFIHSCQDVIHRDLSHGGSLDGTPSDSSTSTEVGRGAGQCMLINVCQMCTILAYSVKVSSSRLYLSLTCPCLCCVCVRVCVRVSRGCKTESLLSCRP